MLGGGRIFCAARNVEITRPPSQSYWTIPKCKWIIRWIWGESVKAKCKHLQKLSWMEDSGDESNSKAWLYLQFVSSMKKCVVVLFQGDNKIIFSAITAQYFQMALDWSRLRSRSICCVVPIMSNIFANFHIDNMHNNIVHVVHVKFCENLKRYRHYTTYRSVSQSGSVFRKPFGNTGPWSQTICRNVAYPAQDAYEPTWTLCIQWSGVWEFLRERQQWL